jgi:hypothetical protein
MNIVSIVAPVRVLKYIHTYVSMYVRIYVRTYICIQVRMYVCMYVHTYTLGMCVYVCKNYGFHY